MAVATASTRRLTPKGRATRQRIVEVASKLMLERGVARTSIEDIRLEASISTSQLYHYFQDKDALVRAVIDLNTDVVLAFHHQTLDRLDSFAALERWRDSVIELLLANQCIGGCPVGSLAGDLAEADPIARALLAHAFARWEQLLSSGLASMRAHGQLAHETDTDALALALLAAIQGGLLLAQTRRECLPMEVALDTVLAQVRACATS